MTRRQLVRHFALTATLYERGLNQPVQTFDLTGYSPRQIERFWDGLVLRIDFARYYITPDLADLKQQAGGRP